MKHDLTMKDYFALGFGAIIGTGWIVLVGDWIILGGGPLEAILAFVIGGLLLLPFGAVFGELASAIPVSGGVIDYADRAFGKKTAFLTGWFVILGNGCLVPWEGVAISQFIDVVWGSVPSLRWLRMWRMTVPHSTGSIAVIPSLIAEIVVCVIIVLNHHGAKLTAVMSRIIVAALTIAVIVIFCVGLFRGNFSNLTHPVFSSISSSASGSVSGTVTKAHDFTGGFITVLVMTPFFYVGFDTIPQAAEEAGSHVDWHRFGWVIMGSIGAAALFYVICITGFTLFQPWPNFVSHSFPAVHVIRLLPVFLSIPLIVIATASPIGPMNSFYAATSRVILEMGRKSLLPSVCARVDKTTGTPTTANIVMAVAALVGPWIPSTFLVSLVSISSFAFVAACMVSAAACWKLRVTEPDLPRPYTVPGGRWGIGAAIVMGVVLLILLIVPFSPGHLTVAEWCGVLIWALLGCCVVACRHIHRHISSYRSR
jgi:APA family basic amino acid/polyamine antiporter